MPMPMPSVSASMSAIAPRPSSTPSSAAESEALRTSQRVPTTRVSYRTTSPRTNGQRDARLPWNPESRRSVAVTMRPSGWRRATAIASRPRIITPSMRAWPP